MSRVIELPSNGGGPVAHVGLTPDRGDLEGKKGGEGGEGEGRGEKEAEEERDHTTPSTDRPGGYHTRREIPLTWQLEWGIRREATCRHDAQHSPARPEGPPQRWP